MPDHLTVTLPLVWRGIEDNDLWLGKWQQVGGVGPNRTATVWWGGTRLTGEVDEFPDRSAAMRAVEEAVRRALGEEGGGDAG